MILLPAMIVRFYQGWFQVLGNRPAAVSRVPPAPIRRSTWPLSAACIPKPGTHVSVICRS